MLQPIDNLRADHRDLRIALSVLAAMAAHVDCGGRFPASDCARVLGYLRDYVVDVHFPKEGASILPAVVMHGGDSDVQAAGEVFRVQQEAQGLLQCLMLFREPRGCDPTAAECEGLVGAARALGSCLERAMQLEERHLFPAAMLAPADDRLSWPAAFAAIELPRRPAAEWRKDLGSLATKWC